MKHFLFFIALVFCCVPRTFAFELKSPDFSSSGMIVAENTCDGADSSPELKWTNPPVGSKSFALIADDPDAPMGIWVHWVMYNIPETIQNLPHGIPKSELFGKVIRQGITDFGRPGYGGPCPPRRFLHHYHFKLYALDLTPELPSGLTKGRLLRAIQSHILAETELIGKYQRKN